MRAACPDHRWHQRAGASITWDGCLSQAERVILQNSRIDLALSELTVSRAAKRSLAAMLQQAKTGLSERVAYRG